MKTIRTGCLVLALATTARAGLVFSFTAASDNVPPQAMQALTQAGERWSAVLGDDISVNISLDFTPLSSSTIAASTCPVLVKTYEEVRAALVSRASTADDMTAVAHLPGGRSFNFLANDPDTGEVFLDNNDSYNNQHMKITRANARALGFFSANSAFIDGGIQFNSILAYDYDPSDGVDADKLDFVGVAAHEIGHILGFISGVDTADYYSDKGPGKARGFDGLAALYVLDLFRYSAASADQQAADFTWGGSPYFSLDGGATNLGFFSTGLYNGDGEQAGHWKDDLGLGVMDPTWWYGQTNPMTALDVRAMDVMGYTPVPEPGAAALMYLAGELAHRVLVRRKTRRASSLG